MRRRRLRRLALALGATALTACGGSAPRHIGPGSGGVGGAQHMAPTPSSHHHGHEKPEAPRAEGESVPPAGHSEHGEQMAEHGGHEHHGHEHHGHEHHGHHGHGMPHRFQDAERWAKVFDDPKRDAWQKPDAVVAAMQLAKDAHVADIGAGTGYFAVRIARAVPRGKVYAQDVEQDMVDYLGKRAAKEGLGNLQPVLGRFEDAALPAKVDVALIVDTYHHISDREGYFRRLGASLKGRAELWVVDFKLGDIPVGPPPKHRVAPERIAEELQAAGYTQLHRDDTTLPYQHILRFRFGAATP
ncbi:MAG: class I SAM-dependent methyltransferase [Deltaproteobacteria bacterium]|nr:class I SAM-dependent methyltransferase [Deltaproteobacteria bacterium]